MRSNSMFSNLVDESYLHCTIHLSVVHRFPSDFRESQKIFRACSSKSNTANFISAPQQS